MKTQLEIEKKLPAQEVYISLGSNMGDREKYLRAAAGAVGQVVDVVQVSSIYQTEPWGNVHQDPFLNAVLKCHSQRDPETLLYMALEIEYELGRRRENTWEPRTIDVDILFAGNSIVDDSDLVLPHPFLHQRKFVLIPMSEIAEDFKHPVFNKSITELLDACEDDGAVDFYAHWDTF